MIQIFETSVLNTKSLCKRNWKCGWWKYRGWWWPIHICPHAIGHCSQPAPEWNHQPRKVKVHSFGKNWHRKVERMFVTFDKSFRISWWWWMVSLLFLIFKIFVSQLLVVWIYRGPLDWLNWAFQARLLNTLPYISETGATDCRKYIISVVSACLPDHVHRNMMSNIKCY